MLLIQIIKQHPNGNGGQVPPSQPEVTITNVNATYDANEITVTYTLNNADNVTSVIVEDASGNTYNAISPTKVSANIDVTNAEPGIATITITVGDKTATTTVEII